MNHAPAIIHEAVILRSDSATGTLTVMVADTQEGECASCAAAAVCHRGKGGEITVRNTSPAKYTPGMKVKIAADSSLHRRAVALMLALPCLMLVLPIVVLCLLGLPEWAACLSGVAMCALTFVVLRLYRKKLNHGMEFRILES